MAVKKAASTSNPISKKLSSVFLVSSALFAKASPAQQTEVLTAAAGGPVLFVSDFSELTSKTRIRDKLLAGVDCSVELEFNEIVLTEEDKRCLELIKPILAKIADIGPKYPWQPEVELTDCECGTDKIVRAGHTASVAECKVIWLKASRYWAGITQKKPGQAYHYMRSGSGGQYVDISSAYVKIGCQTIARAEVEALARHYGWEPKLS